MANAVDHEQKEQAAAAREKSAVLEEKAWAEGSKTQSTPAEIITKQQVQSVDRTGAEPLEDAITCLAQHLLGGEPHG